MVRELPVVIVLGLMLILTASTLHAASVIMVRGDSPGSSADLCAELVDGVVRAEFSVNETSPSELSVTLDKEEGPGSVLVLPDARFFPAEAKHSLLSFLKRGNHLIALSGPAFGNMMVEHQGSWLTQSQAKEELAREQGQPIVRFNTDFVDQWQRHSGTLSNPAEYSVLEPDDPHIRGNALHAKISQLDDWETLVSPPLSNPFGAGHTAFAFSAKGGPDTRELVVEWRETDSSRWMAVVPLGTEWERHALTPEDFRFWGDGSPTGRGKQGDRFNPAKAEAVSFGLANGISHQKMNVAHEYWITDVQAIEDPYQDVDFAPPLLESLSPVYKTHKTAANALKLIYWNETLPIEAAVTAPIPRSPGIGANALNKRRLIPVVQALGDKGELRGSAAHMFINSSGDYAGSVWGYIGLDQTFLVEHTDKALQVVVHMLERMRDGVFLCNAGTQHIAYTEGEEIKCGAYLINLSGRELDYVDTMFQVFRDGKILASDYVRTQLAPHSGPVFVDGTPAVKDQINAGPGVYTMKVWTSVRGKVVDEIGHEFRIISYGPLQDKNTVTTRGGDFYLDGKKWHPLGINYWPRYATGLEQDDYWLHWLSPEQYNPEVIEQDLAIAETLGMNLVSIQYRKLDEARPLMDFMARAEQHNIKVNVYTPGLDPLHQDFKLANSLITAAHLAQSPAMFAYDVGWEVHVGNYDVRKAYDQAWQDWVMERYGSTQSAEDDWGYQPSRVNGVITGPSDTQLQNDGNWRIYVAAYRRFWDDEISKRYMAVRDNIRSVDPYHLIGARSGYGGTGAQWIVPSFPFDLTSGVKHLDFVSPEAYGLGGDKADFLKGGLNTLYGRFVSGGKPVYWAEYGISIWPKCNTEAFEEARDYYENVLDMIYLSHASGSAGWWWPGGLRLGENSDYGIINPDATSRPAALEIGKAAARFAQLADTPKPDLSMLIDRDKHVTGYAGVYAAHCQEYADALLNGHEPAMRTECTGTTSASTPLIAVGNVPCNGHNPPKYLNAEFNYVKVNGRAVTDGETVTVRRGKPLILEVSVGNTCEATWLPVDDTEKGAVALVVTARGGPGKVYEFIDSATPYLSDAILEEVEIPEGIESVSMRMAACGRVEFGEVFDLRFEWE